MTNRIESFFTAPNTESAYKGDYTKATIYLHLDANIRSGILESYKKPLENQVCSASVQ